MNSRKTLPPRSLFYPLYQTMKDIHELLEKSEIEYLKDSGTLIGAVRHKGIIPSNNDLDLCLDYRVEEKFLSLRPLP